MVRLLASFLLRKTFQSHSPVNLFNQPVLRLEFYTTMRCVRQQNKPSRLCTRKSWRWKPGAIELLAAIIHPHTHQR